MSGSIDLKKDSLQLYLQSLLSTVTTEDPMAYFNDMYKSINPHCVVVAKEEAKKVLKEENKCKNDKLVNCYLTLGGDGINRYLMEGILAGLIWLPLYIKDVAETFKLSRDEVETTIKVLNTISLPKITDFTAFIPNASSAKSTESTESAKSTESFAKSSQSNTVINACSCRHYASFLIAIIRWLTTGITAFKNTGDPRSNLEMIRYLTATTLNTFPAIPYCAYFIGQTHTADMAKLCEKLAKSVDFNEFMTKEAYQINSPKFVVQTPDAPLVGISGHPLGDLYVGMLDSTTKKTEWLGVFVKSEQFEQLCVENGLNVNDVHAYVMGVSKEQHEKILLDKDNKRYNIAAFIEKQGNDLIKTGYELFHKNDAKRYVTDNDFATA